MSILIVDDEETTRAALREILMALGHENVIEAKNGEEALRRVTEIDKDQIEMIISDWEMPYLDGLEFLAKLTARNETELIPFVLITSDLPETQLRILEPKYPRLDAHVIKPFQKAALEKAMNSAYQRRQKIRSKIAFLSSESKAYTAENEKWQKQHHKDKIEWVRFENSTDLLNSLHSDPTHWAGVIIDPKQYILNEPWLNAFKKKAGRNLIVGCLASDPSAVLKSGDLQNNSAIFSESLLKLAEKLIFRGLNSWQFSRLFQLAKAAQQKKNIKLAKKNIEQILSVDSENVEALTIVAEFETENSEIKSATKYFSKALELNPYSPNANIKFLKFAVGNKLKAEAEKTAEGILKNFNSNPDVLSSAAAILKSQEFLDKALSLNPNHPGLKRLKENAPTS